MSAAANNVSELRKERRVGVESMVLPFLGSLAEEFSPFQYVLADLSPHGAKIMLPSWLSLRERVRKGDMVDLHAPFRFAGETYSTGEIVWDRFDEDNDAQACGIHFERRTPQIYPIFISFDEHAVSVDLTDFQSPGGLMLRVFKDAILLKRGIAIYLKHLAPYLSRISGSDKKQYGFLRHFLLDDAAQHVERNRKRLEAVYKELAAGACIQEDLAACVSVEDLLEHFEPEIPADVFTQAFMSKAVAPYLRSIKALEKKLYSTYNTLMLLYLHSIQPSARHE